MIIKKPYAFLIKHFRLIHAVLLGLLVFILANSFNIYSFFSNYAKTHLYNNTYDLADSYISGGLYFACFLAIGITFVIYYILAIKQKSNKAYLFIFLYYIILIFYFLYIHKVFDGLEQVSLNIESIRAMRDISIIVVIPQAGIIFIVIGRTLGFNLKQFDFKKDLEELEIDTSDNEEVEVTLGNDTYKIARFFRKMLRLSKYFVLENKLFVIGTVSVIVLGTSFYFFNKLNVYKESYEENQFINASLLNFKINGSYITQVDKNNIIIKKGKYYILVDVFISNKTATSVLLDRDMFRLKTDEELLLPSYVHNNSFTDIGDVFVPFELKPGTDASKLVVFEIDSKDLSKQYLLKINNTTGGTDKFRDVLINPNSLNENKDEGNFTIPNEVELTNSILKDSTVHISSCEFGEKFKEKYTYVLNGKAYETSFPVAPDSTNKSESVVLKIKANIKMDESVFLSKSIVYPADLFEQYGIIRYRYQGNYKTVKLEKINVGVNYDKENYAYMQLTKEVTLANKIELIILIRGVKYTFNLK